MWRVAMHVAAYCVVASTVWWQVYVQTGGHISMVVAGLTTALLVILLLLDLEWLVSAAQQRREAAASARAVRENERLRRRAYDLCASLRLGFDICEGCWVLHPDRATKELDRLRAAVGYFLTVDLGASG